MINKIKPAILSIISFLLLQITYGQERKDMTDYLKQKFLMYSVAVPREELFLQSDRDEYVSGEDFWFSVYLIDRQSFKSSPNSRIVYFELMNAVNKPVVQKRILLNNGIGPGHIVLPDTLSTGIYTIRAYTNWMKNFLPVNCFMKDIAIYNTLSNKGSKGKLSFKKNRIKNVVQDIKSTPITMTVNNSKQDTLEVTLVSANQFRIDNNNLLYIFIQTHGNINFVSSENLTPGTTNIDIPKTLLSSGINQITIFNSKGEPVCERYIYTPVREDNFLALHSDDSCYLRDKITLEIEPAKNALQVFKSTNLSLSVAPAGDDEAIMEMPDYLIFGTEYGLTGWNSINGEKIKEIPPASIDSILLNVKSNWINWTTILSGDLPHFKYEAEKEDHFLYGKLLKSDQQLVQSGKIVLMSTPGKEAAFQYARTDNGGNFNFKIPIDEDLKDLIIMPDDAGKDQKVVIESSFSDQYLKHEVSVDSFPIPLSFQVSKLSVNHQVQKIFEISSMGSPLKPFFPSVHPVRFYGKPDIELILADYISLPVMSEIFFELLPDVSLKKKKSAYEISITYRVGDDLFVTSPCLMIDGVIIKDASLIANLDPEIVEKIDVIKEKYLVGKYIFPGIVNVITKSGEFNCVTLPDYMSRLTYRIADPVRSFVSPDYSLPEMRKNRIPDYRNTLYWNPSVKPDKDGKARVEFWSSDNKSDYVINIQGITEEGKAFSLQKTLKVK